MDEYTITLLGAPVRSLLLTREKYFRSLESPPQLCAWLRINAWAVRARDRVRAWGKRKPV